MSSLGRGVVAALTVVAGCVGACSSDGSAKKGGDAGTDANVMCKPPPDSGGNCLVYAVDFDQSCTTDSDCVAVVTGGDTCDPCGAPYLFLCPGMATVNVGASAAYYAAISCAEGASAGGCGKPYDCGIAEVAWCKNGACALKIPLPNSGGLPTVDAGIAPADSSTGDAAADSSRD